jgi:Predicted membrane protein
VLPGAAERILKMAEDEANHRRDMDRFTGKASVRAANWGIICAFMSVVLVCGLVAFAIYKDFSTAASTIAVGAIATVASVFIFFKRKGK